MCPMCGGFEVRLFEFDCGAGTEYHQAGEAFRCLACGAVGDVADLEEDPWSDCPAPEDFWDEPPPFDTEDEPIQAQPIRAEVPEWHEDVA